MKFDGIWTPVVTPLHDDGSINYDQIGTVVDHLITAGVHGLIIGGTTGEYYAFSHDDRLALFDAYIKANDKRLPLVAGINAATTEQALAFGEHAKRVGYDALLVATPFYSQPAQDELVTHVEQIDDALDMPIMLYNFPDRTGTPMSREFIDAIKQRPNVQSIKESTGSIERLHMLANEYHQDIQLCCGMDDQALEYFAWGVTSWVAGASNFLPKQHLALYEACVEKKDFVEGRRVMQELMPMLQLLEQGGKFCQYIKYGCELAGMPVGPAHSPLRALNEKEKSDFKKVYRNFSS